MVVVVMMLLPDVLSSFHMHAPVLYGNEIVVLYSLSGIVQVDITFKVPQVDRTLVW